MNVLINSIQRFSLHDGPGIRTTVFMKGCSVHCPWCANPECIAAHQEFYLDSKKCLGENCVFDPSCPAAKNGISSDDIEASKKCPIGAVGTYGMRMSNKELIQEILKDKAYYGEDGGVTFSGGETLLYVNELSHITAYLRNQGVHTCVESGLFVRSDNVLTASQIFDMFIIDIKLIDEEKCYDVIGGDVELYKKNLHIIFNAKKDVIVRFPVVPGITDTKENLRSIRDIISKYNPCKLELLGVHNLAKGKWSSLGKPFRSFVEPTFRELESIRNYFAEKCIFRIDICKV